MGLNSGLSYDSIFRLIEMGEGDDARRLWVTAWGLLRISTNPRLSKYSLQPAEAISIIGELRAHPLVMMVNPGRRHEEILLQQMQRAQVRGRETADAVLAALAIENGATLAATDSGFRRFPDLRWVNPLA